MRTRRAEKWFLVSAGGVLAAALLIHPVAPKVRAQGTTPNVDRFKAVKEWVLTYNYEFNDPGSFTADNGDHCDRSELRHFEEGKFTLRPKNISEGSAEFEGEGKVSVSLGMKMECTSPADWYRLLEDHGEVLAPSKARMTLDFASGQYWIDFDPAKPKLIGSV